MTDNNPLTIGLLIPTTSNRKTWLNIKDSYIYTIFLSSFAVTCNKNFKFILYLGFDYDDKLFNNSDNLSELNDIISKYPNITLKTVLFGNDIKKGHLTKMWNILYQEAYSTCDYFYQCGDDILLLDIGWDIECVNRLKLNQNIGVVGPVDLGHPSLLTQSFVSKKHMDIFGYYYPEELINWQCDDWIQGVYDPQYSIIIKEYTCKNAGGAERYEIYNYDELRKQLVIRDQIKLNKYIHHDFYDQKLVKIISFSLYGTHPIYTYGAIENAILALTLYPTWICRFYYNDTVPTKIIEALKLMKNTEIIKINTHCGNINMLWRFNPLFDKNVDIVISRDTDSRLNRKEVIAVKQWLLSDKNFHIMRDHQNHGTEILGGMFGARNKVAINFENDFYNFAHANIVGSDQNFLRNIIYPHVKKINTIYSHDQHFNYESDKHNYPKLDCHNFTFIGDIVENVSIACNYLNEPIIDIDSANFDNLSRRDTSNKIINYDFITEDALVKLSDYSISRKKNNLNEIKNLSEIKKNSIIVLTGYNHIIKHFFAEIMPHIKKPIILITLESNDIPIRKKYIENPLIIHWFTWNQTFDHKKLTGIPMGLNYDRHEQSIIKYLNMKQNEDYRNRDNKKWLLLNCKESTNNTRSLLFQLAKTKWKDFAEIIDYHGYNNTYIKPSYVDENITINVTKPITYKLYDGYKFVLCPQGVGIDCHKTWETLYVGAIPIVLKHQYMDKLYHHLPIVVVDSWEEITIDFLKTKYEKLKHMSNINIKKIKFSYWKSIITNKFIP